MSNKLLSIITTTVLSLIIFSSTSYASDYYRWVDDQGTTHYGSTPPEQFQDTAERVRTFSGRSESVPLQKVDAPKEEAEDAKPDQAEKQKPKKDKAACERARQQLQKIQRSAIVRVKDKDGNITVVDRKKKLQELQRTIDKEC